MAAKYMSKERPGDSLQATALVHEVFLRLVEVDNVSWQDRAHFFAVSANMPSSNHLRRKLDPCFYSIVSLSLPNA